MRNQYLTLSEIEKMPLAEIENILTKNLQIAEDSDWDLDPRFFQELEMLTKLVKAKGSTKRW